MADLCAKRNYLAIKPLQENFPYEICCEILQSTAYDCMIKEVFCNFIMTVWIDVLPMNKIMMPNYIKIWSDVAGYKGDDLAPVMRDRFSSIKAFIFEYFNIKKDDIRILSTQANL
jgi:hypothetical protein